MNLRNEPTIEVLRRAKLGDVFRFRVTDIGRDMMGEPYARAEAIDVQVVADIDLEYDGDYAIYTEEGMGLLCTLMGAAGSKSISVAVRNQEKYPGMADIARESIVVVGLVRHICSRPPPPTPVEILPSGGN